MCAQSSFCWAITTEQVITILRHHHHHRHQFLLSFRGHRASTKNRHLVLFPAILLTLLQLFPFSNASLRTNLRHVCLGLPLLLFLCRFQSKTSLSLDGFIFFLSVCPIQFHFRILICLDTSVSSVLLQSSSFEITSGQWMFRVLRKHRLTKITMITSSLFVISICSGCTAAWRLLVLDPIYSSNLSYFRHQMSPRPTRRERSKQWKVELLWARN